MNSSEARLAALADRAGEAVRSNPNLARALAADGWISLQAAAEFLRAAALDQKAAAGAAPAASPPPPPPAPATTAAPSVIRLPAVASGPRPEDVRAGWARAAKKAGLMRADDSAAAPQSPQHRIVAEVKQRYAGIR